MLTNKWIQFGMSALMSLFASASALDWSSVLSSKTSAGIAAGIGVGKMILNALAPAAGQPVEPTGGTIVTHQVI